jgi:hypothetical protein
VSEDPFVFKGRDPALGRRVHRAVEDLPDEFRVA